MTAYSWRDLARDLREGPFTSLGSYPKFFLGEDGATVSFAAVKADALFYLRETAKGKAGFPHRIVACEVNWENPELHCDVTGERIPSAYAEPEEDDEGCSSCDSAEWGTRVPIPGVLLTVEDRVERCDECSRFTSDDAAQLAFAHELCKRGFAEYAVTPIGEEDCADPEGDD